jgi:hypothetical protein
MARKPGRNYCCQKSGVPIVGINPLAAGDRIEIGAEIFLVQGTPKRDRERLVWTAELLLYWPDPHADVTS